jgi:hypothetical protein
LPPGGKGCQVLCFFTAKEATMSSAAMHIESFFDPATFTFSHILADLSTRQ